MSALNVHVRDAEGILERILMTTRRRGFRLYGCEVNLCNNLPALAAADATHYDITLYVESERPLSFLSNQLQKLVDVVRVSEQLEQRHVRRA